MEMVMSSWSKAVDDILQKSCSINFLPDKDFTKHSQRHFWLIKSLFDTRSLGHGPVGPSSLLDSLMALFVCLRYQRFVRSQSSFEIPEIFWDTRVFWDPTGIIPENLSMTRCARISLGASGLMYGGLNAPLMEKWLLTYWLLQTNRQKAPNLPFRCLHVNNQQYQQRSHRAHFWYFENLVVQFPPRIQIHIHGLFW